MVPVVIPRKGGYRAGRAARWIGSGTYGPRRRGRLPVLTVTGAGCGRLIPRAGLTINGASVAGWCVNCLTAGPPGERASETDRIRGE
jgi:hypothetical protein